MQTEITIIIGAVITGLITLDKLGILDKAFRRNGKTRATKNDIDHLADNHLHTLGEKIDKQTEQHEKQIELQQESLYILKDIKNHLIK